MKFILIRLVYFLAGMLITLSFKLFQAKSSKKNEDAKKKNEVKNIDVENIYEQLSETKKEATVFFKDLPSNDIRHRQREFFFFELTKTEEKIDSLNHLITSMQSYGKNLNEENGFAEKSLEEKTHFVSELELCCHFAVHKLLDISKEMEKAESFLEQLKLGSSVTSMRYIRLKKA